MSTIIKLQVRLPEDIHKLLRELRLTDRRSLNGEIVALLEESLIKRGYREKREDTK